MSNAGGLVLANTDNNIATYSPTSQIVCLQYNGLTKGCQLSRRLHNDNIAPFNGILSPTYNVLDLAKTYLHIKNPTVQHVIVYNTFVVVEFK